MPDSPRRRQLPNALFTGGVCPATRRSKALPKGVWTLLPHPPRPQLQALILRPASRTARRSPAFVVPVGGSVRFCRPQVSSGSSGPYRRMETSLLSQGVVGWPLVSGWERQLLAPGPWGWASARLGPGHVRLGSASRARHGYTGLSGRLWRASFAGPGTEAGRSSSLL